MIVLFNKLCLGLLRLYDFMVFSKLIKRFVFSVPIISIGNIVIGGTGKTPFVQYLSQALKKHNITSVIVSRGYKKNSGGTYVVHNGSQRRCDSPYVCGDEPFMLASKPGCVPIVVDNKKTRGIAFAIQKFKPQVVLLDDSFQSRYIKKNFDIVLFNTLNTKQDLNFFPFGKLRDNIASLQNASLVVFTKNNLSSVNSSGVDYILPIIKKYGVPYLYSNTSTSLIKYILNKKEKLTWSAPSQVFSMPKQQRLFSFCGIGDPNSFTKTTNTYQNSVVVHANFSDHYNYYKHEKQFLQTLRSLYDQHDITGILTTHKDFVKIQNLSAGFLDWCHRVRLNFFVLEIELQVNNEDFIIRKIKNLGL